MKGKEEKRVDHRVMGCHRSTSELWNWKGKPVEGFVGQRNDIL